MFDELVEVSEGSIGALHAAEGADSCETISSGMRLSASLLLAVKYVPPSEKAANVGVASPDDLRQGLFDGLTGDSGGVWCSFLTTGSLVWFYNGAR